MKNLVIVESPAKAKTISSYLGKDFTVLSSVGHIRNIAKKSKTLPHPVDPEADFKIIYEVDSTKKKTIAELKKAVKEANEVWLATDEDREGEAIAWHLCEVLKLNPKTTKRITFHEITKEAIQKAVASPRTIDMDLVLAQQARQALDWLVGFELSPVVWKKVPGGKSAGRVQSPAVRLLVEKETEIEKFQTSSDFKIRAILTKAKQRVVAELTNRAKDETEAQEVLKQLITDSFVVTDISKTPSSRQPSAPFTTSTLQQEANRKLGYSAKTTMATAQKLYQTGKITYMRTDSTNLSVQASSQIAGYITKIFGKDYLQIRHYKTKNTTAQEAHEAIRPTDINKEVVSKNDFEQKLYNLIRQRTLASQMAGAKIEKTKITFQAVRDKIILEAKGEAIIFPGFLKIYPTKDQITLPTVKENETWQITNAEAEQVYSRGPARFTEGSLVKKLEELGIGRPSTYATIINTILERNYVQKGETDGREREITILKVSLNKPQPETTVSTEKTGSEKGKLIPTSTGEVLTSFLIDYFNLVVDYNFTAQAEQGLDQIASGTADRNQILNEIYTPFHQLITDSDKIERSAVSKSREIGTDPKTGKMIIARFGRFGPVLQKGNETEKDKPQFAPIPSGYKIETVSLKIALKAFELPRVVGKTPEGDTIKANVGRFGPYIQINNKFVNLKESDPYTISEEEAIRLYQEKLQAEKAKTIADFGDLKIIKGHFGPYLTDGKKNIKITKDLDPTKMSDEEARNYFKNPPKNKKPARRKKK